MKLLQYIEQQLGPIDTCPTYITRHLFIDDPTPNNLKKVAAFFYGNGVPKSTASKLYGVCNGGHESYITQYIGGINIGTRLYYPHMVEYYNVRHHTFMWINGRRLDQMEVVKPQVLVMDFGFYYSRCESLIRSELEMVRLIG